ncbi:serine/threonine-protein phosphatase 7 long form homolog [Panicum virgatum]|uniref:serine/threonine-protein phosphatase 7 long form homolog n=1 Tax=Panicum virgatum TaxID=38727 RepID=UPI0019D5ABC2|nr:serine/threonine-protein phosphatase 7 long form homolog [Panicum virgatum]
MDANFFDHLKNKELKDLFKRLCTQNQQRKFNALWQMLDQLTAEQVKARAAGTSSSQLRECGLLTPGRLVEGGIVKLDRSLLTALVDRWRPETHTFHLPCGELTPTLQDVAYLLGLPIVSDAVGPRVVPALWKDNLEERFAPVQRVAAAGPINPHPRATGPSKTWLLQFTPTQLDADADEYSVTRSLEAYLLWLFGYIMFNNTHGNSVDRILLPYAREIADAEDDLPPYSWGSAILAATYRGLCDGCSKTDGEAIFSGCPLLLQLWSYERIAVGRPIVSQEPYHDILYGDDEEGWPIMGTLWNWRHRSWAHAQVRLAYPDFVSELDMLTLEDVIWESYTPEAVARRAPLGLSPHCSANAGMWLTTVVLVYDIAVVEEWHVVLSRLAHHDAAVVGAMGRCR